MEEGSKGRSWPIPDADKIKKAGCKLEEALAVEDQYVLNYLDRKPWEVSMSDRDNAVHVLRFLKIWFDLPQTVFFSAVSFLDQFLMRMKVHSKYLSCLAVSCLNVATEIHSFTVNASQLVMLSQSKCSVKDMQRMSSIVTQKLNLNNSNNHRNSLDFLIIYLDVFRCIAVYLKIDVLLNRMLEEQQLGTKLEVLISDSTCATYSPSLLSLALIECEVQQFLAKEVPKKSNYYSKEMFYLVSVIVELQGLAKLSADDQTSCFANVKNVLKNYDDQNKTKHFQKLEWNFSPATMLSSNSYRNYYTVLNTVKEE